MFSRVLCTWLVLHVLHVHRVNSACPHEDASLKKWSVAADWPSGQVPIENDAVSVTGNFLLDVSPPQLTGINITETGSLVWSPDVDINLRLRYVSVFGKLVIGSEDCKYERKTRITLIGKRGEHVIPGHMGEKVLGVGENGILEIHGREVTPWTKLAATLPAIKTTNGVYFDHANSDNYWYKYYYDGLAIYVFDPNDLANPEYRPFRTNEHLADLLAYLDEVKAMPGKVVLVASQREMTLNANMAAIADSLEELLYGSVTSQSVFRSVQANQVYAAMTVVGSPGTTLENKEILHAKDTYLTTRVAQVIDNRKFTVESHRWLTKTWMDYRIFRVSNPDVSNPVLNVIDDVSNWREGDVVVVTSTDFDFEHAEIGTVLDCPFCTNKQVRVDLEPQFEHFGRIAHNTDMRAEVALLTRNIVIEGEMQTTCGAENGNCAEFTYDTFGGHAKFVHHVGDIHVEFAEFYHMGQQTALGHYPLHFHMCEDVDDSPSPSYLRGNSIHHSFARCITVHGTHGAQLLDNVCYHHLGHGYFLEDGGEKRTVLDGNIGISTYDTKGSLIPSDEKATTFWITNPQTYIRNNVAAGSEDFGMWILYPISPIGPSAAFNFMQPDEARHTALYEFFNNVVHSCDNVGLQIDQKLQADGSADDSNNHNPVEDPLDPNSPDKMIYISRLTAYNNRQSNVWTRGGLYNFTHVSLVNSAEGITFARSTSQEQFIDQSVIVGLSSENVGQSPSFVSLKIDGTWTDVEVERDLPYDYYIDHPIQGFIFYDGPVYVSNVWFDGFISTSNYSAGALGFQRNNRFSSSPVSGVQNILFGFQDGPSTGNRVYDGDGTMNHFGSLDGDKSATFRDYDGSVTGLVQGQVVKPQPFYTTAQCVYRSNWNMDYCPHRYGKLQLKYSLTDNGNTQPIMVRDDIPEVNETLTYEKSAQFMTILGGSQSYTLHFTGSVPSQFTIYSKGYELDYWARFGVCVNTENFELYTYSPSWAPKKSDWTQATDMADLEADMTGKKYLFDADTGLVFFKFRAKFNRDASTTSECEDTCPMVRITINDAPAPAGNCISAAYDKYKRDPIPAASQGTSFPATAAEPPLTWGAGETRPFTSRIPVNGGYSEWSEWSTCDEPCGGGISYRRRSCDNPIPANGGNDCVGPNVETQSCNVHPCPVNGGWGPWSVWGTCLQTGGSNGCHGYRLRSRSCDNPAPAHGGKYCDDGATTESQQCDYCTPA